MLREFYLLYSVYITYANLRLLSLVISGDSKKHFKGCKIVRVWVQVCPLEWKAMAKGNIWNQR